MSHRTLRHVHSRALKRVAKRLAPAPRVRYLFNCNEYITLVSILRTELKEMSFLFVPQPPEPTWEILITAICIDRIRMLAMIARLRRDAMTVIAQSAQLAPLHGRKAYAGLCTLIQRSIDIYNDTILEYMQRPEYVHGSFGRPLVEPLTEPPAIRRVDIARLMQLLDAANASGPSQFAGVYRIYLAEYGDNVNRLQEMIADNPSLLTTSPPRFPDPDAEPRGIDLAELMAALDSSAGMPSTEAILDATAPAEAILGAATPAEATRIVLNRGTARLHATVIPTTGDPAADTALTLIYRMITLCSMLHYIRTAIHCREILVALNAAEPTGRLPRRSTSLQMYQLNELVTRRWMEHAAEYQALGVGVPTAPR